jgi:tetratricopeptide (TPR) repeat protein
MLFDDGGFLDEEGHLRDEIKTIVTLTQASREVYAAYITWRRPFVDIPAPFPIIQLRPLGPTETKRLLSLLIRHNKLDIQGDNIEELAEYVGGYPPAAYFVVQLCKDYGIELMLREKSSLARFTSEIFLRHFSKIGLSRDEIRILRLLASYSPLPLGTITLVLEIEDGKLDAYLLRMIDLALVIPTDCAYYQIADPIADASIRAFGYLDQREHERVARSLSLFLSDPELEGPQLQLSRLLFKAGYLCGDNTITASTLHFANDLIKLTETLYHQRKYIEAVDTGYLALSERPNSITARRYLIRGFIQEERWTEAEKQIEEFKKFAPNREILYHLGFLNRHRNRIPEAIKYYTQAKDRGWTGIAIRRELANCHFLLGEYTPAAEHIKEARDIRSDNRFVVDLDAQIAIARKDQPSAKNAIEILRVIDEPNYYYHRLSTYERRFGTMKDALIAAEKAAAECIDSPPFAVLVQLICCQIDSKKIPEARDTLKYLDKRYGRIKNDVRYSLRMKLEITDAAFAEAIRLSKFIEDKETDIYKGLIIDALTGELATSALTDDTRREYQTKLTALKAEVGEKQIEELLSLIFNAEKY